MQVLEKTSVLRRGAAPPDERSTAIFLAASCLLHAALLALFITKAREPIRVALPESGGAPRSRQQLVRLSPLRTFPPAEAVTEPAEASRSRPKPALIKRYTPGAQVVVREERGPTKKGAAADEAKTSPRTLAATPSADLSPRWYSADSSRITSVATDGDFRWSSYLAAIRNKIGSRWVPPPGMEAPGGLVRAKLYFRIHRDGQISVQRVESSSGHAFFDQTAMRALLAATPLPPLPAEYTDSYLGVHFGFEYQQ
jgi:TonB family protein